LRKLRGALEQLGFLLEIQLEMAHEPHSTNKTQSAGGSGDRSSHPTDEDWYFFGGFFW
jgi:hypothetical protein